MSHEQTMTALAKANHHRLARADVVAEIAAGRRTVADALADPCCATARVLDMLTWQHHWGVLKAERFLEETKICSPFQVAGALTDRQRALIARELHPTAVAA